jgi:hypothetical protein
MIGIIHLAGPMGRDGVQRCSRCGTILIDYRRAMVLPGGMLGCGWAEDEPMTQYDGNPTSQVAGIEPNAVPCQQGSDTKQ